MKELNARHKSEVADLTLELNNSYLEESSQSKEYLDLKSYQDDLIQKQNFIEANALKKSINYLEKSDKFKSQKEKNQNFKAEIDKLHCKHVLEKQNLIKENKEKEEAILKEKKETIEEMTKNFLKIHLLK